MPPCCTTHVTVCANYFTLRNFTKNLFPEVSRMQHTRNVIKFICPYMIKMENYRIFFPTINTRMLPKVF